MTQDTKSCYICMENCDMETSPCICQAPVHYTCLRNFRQQCYHDNNMRSVQECTICNSNYIEEPYTMNELQPILVYHEIHQENNACRKVLAFVVIACLMMYIIKVFEYLSNNGRDDAFWYPYYPDFYVYIFLSLLLFGCCFSSSGSTQTSSSTSSSDEVINV
jgi:hypothetical protein